MVNVTPRSKNPFVVQMIERLYQDNAAKRASEAQAQQQIAANRPALQAAPLGAPAPSKAIGSLERAMANGSTLAGSLAGLTDAMDARSARAAEERKNLYLQEAMKSKDPAALYMAGAGGFADALMNKESREKAAETAFEGQKIANILGAAKADADYGIEKEKLSLGYDKLNQDKADNKTEAAQKIKENLAKYLHSINANAETQAYVMEHPEAVKDIVTIKTSGTGMISGLRPGFLERVTKDASPENNQKIRWTNTTTQSANPLGTQNTQLQGTGRRRA
ncbi:hypothetical protein AGMMS49543_26580 [Betaproteobacteria bacterium]|nr:hypothetical protein AGMMS49543_26580 [Betaproteobacteria bacterium]